MSNNDNLALLAAAAYGNLNDIKNEDNIHKAFKSEKIAKEYAEKFTNTYEIIAHQPNTASGYSGTIVKNRHSGEYFVLHRGTENRTDLVEDLVLATKGIPENQIQDAKLFVDNAIRAGVIRGRFTNVGHSLGKSIADLIHFTTDLSKGSIGFNGAGSAFWRGSLNVNSSVMPTSDIPDSRFGDLIKNRRLLEQLARENGNTFNFNKENVINYVSNGVRLIPNNVIYNQHGKIIQLDIGSPKHSILPFIDSMEYTIKLKSKYNLTLEESISYYNKARSYYNTFEFGKLFDPPHNKAHSVLDDFISQHDRINKPNLESFIKQSFLTSDKYHYRKHIPWPEPHHNGNIKNNIRFTPKSNILEEKANNNFHHIPLTNELFSGFNHDAINKSTKPKDLSPAAIVTDDMQPDRMNLYPYIAIDTSAITHSLLNSATRINRAQGKSFKTPVDPLILDLNGDGVKTVSYTEKPVLFDIDNDGGSLEETGWLSHQDGLLVRDLNNNGKIDNMAEVFSEYYAGRAGQNGEAGEKRFKNGFEALKTLDSNHDNIFDSKDRDFSKVRVWQDANHNGITDSGELKTLSSLGITAIELSYQNMGGQLFGGNELLARGYFTRNGKKQEAAAVNFLANPRGHTITNVSGGKKTITEAAGVLEQTSSYTASDNRSRVLSAAALGVANIQAGDGNDTLHGDAQDNWLAGGGGSDTFFGGEGDDVLLIDGDDLPENIHGGAGDDIVQVIGDKGVSLDLAAAEVEIAHGGRGDDVFVSSGNSSIFVRGGDGNDTIVGSIANDALSGENGDDFISGNAGKDLIRGHRGNDRLFGDEGDDVLFGGSDDDMLYGGEGNDTLLGEGGDDYLDGGEGEDVAEFSGNFADYKITKMGDGVLVSDRTQGRDGTDFLRNIEKLNFKDLTGYQAPSATKEWENPMPVEDILYRDSRGQRFDGSRPYIIKQSQLLKNDIDLQGDDIIIYQASNIRGGSLKVLSNGDIEFTPSQNFKGIASFEYSIQDAKGIKALHRASGEITGKVYLVPPSLPSDPDVIRQYYLEADNISPVWQHYTGKNIRIGQFEPSGPNSVAEEVADYRHPELRHQMDKQWLHDYEYKRQEEDKVFSKHATEVAGVMVAERNGEGGVGVAYDAKVASHWVGESVASLDKMKHYDVANHSWGHTKNFRQQLSFTDKNKTIFDVYKPALTEGRHGLGTVIVNSAGNERREGGNTNYSELTNVRYSIATASAQRNAQFETSIAPYSNPGASVLVTAHGSNVYSSSREIVNDNGTKLGQEYARNNGTSFSAPIVSGVVALMLEANPYLGYRDIQDILALTATTKGITDSQWQRNGAKNWNGTGMHVSHDYGYGVIDAQAAVRLAQNWNTQQTYANEVKLEDIYQSGAVNQEITDHNGKQFSVNVSNSSMQLENVSVKVNLTHTRASDLIIKLISPSGTASILMNRPGKNPADDNAVGDIKFGESSTLHYTFNTTLLKGENPNGQWKLQVFDVATGNTGTLHDWSLSFYGKAYSGSDTYVYTDEFHNSQTVDVLNDMNGGIDTINAAAMDGIIEVNLSTGKANLAGKALTIINPQQIENVTGGDYNDTLTGNDAANLLIGGRGNDILTGLQGNDVLVGGLGNNTLTGGQGSDVFIIEKKSNSQDVITDFQSGVDRLVFTGFESFSWSKQQRGTDTIISLENGQTVRLNNTQANTITSNNIVVTTDVFKPYWLNQTGGYGFSNNSNAQVVLPDFGVAFWGTEAENQLFGGNGDDVLHGGKGKDIIVGENSSDSITGGNDRLYGYAGDDRLFGGGGNDTLYGGSGDDYLGGGEGNDILYLEGDDTALSSSYRNRQYTTLERYNNVEFSWARAEGGKGSDRFVVVKDNSQNASKGLLKNLIWDFDINDKNEKIDLTQFKGLNSVSLQTFSVNGEQYTRVWLGEPKAGTQYITLKGIHANQVTAEMFIFSKEQANLPQLQQAILGTYGHDNLTGNAISNLLDGKTGADTMAGEFGDDTYMVDNTGDRVIEIRDGGYDVVKSSVSYTLPDYVEELQLIGRSSINATGNSENNRLLGNSGNNRLDGKAGFDTMIGYAGNDTYVVDSHLDKVIEKENQGTDTVISSVSYTLPENVEHLELIGTAAISATGNAAHNSLQGNAGNNRLMGYEGDDTLNGQQGNDFLMGGIGNDTYLFGRGDGIDSIYDEQGRDTLRFSNINHDQLWLRKSGDDLEISVIGTQDKVLITEWYGKNYKVENVVAANNKQISAANVEQLVNAMAAFSPPAAGQISLPPTLQTALNPMLSANWR